MATEHEKWRRLLQPLVTGLASLMAIATLYLQRSDNDKTESRASTIKKRGVKYGRKYHKSA